MRLAEDVRAYRRLRWSIGAALLVTALIPAAGWLLDAIETRGPVQAASAPSAVTALGRVQPEDGVLALAAPAADSGPAIVAALHVREGEWLEAGQVVATLRGREERVASVAAKRQRVAIARARLHALGAGGKQDDVAALRAEVAREDAALIHARAEADRAARLHRDGLIATSAWQAQQSTVAIAGRSLDAARARLDSLSSVRPADLAVVAAELHAAEADLGEAAAQLEATVIRAPAAGRVLAIHAYPGQSVGAEGILSFGRTAVMFVDAEVLEDDLPRLHVGMPVQIRGDVLRAPVTGRIDAIGLMVGSREVFRNDPTGFTDARIVHVKVKADQPEPLARVINARVSVVMIP